MKLTKFSHACVLVEDEEHTVLFDPGKFAWQSGQVKLDSWSKLDRVIITHEHFDHFHPEFVDAIVKQFPNVKILSTESVVSQLSAKGINSASSVSDGLVDIQPLSHESMEPLAPPPCQNVRAHYKGVVTHPGDSHHLEDTKEILLLPVSGPWGATIEAVRMAVRLKPKAVMPIHDWMWNDEWRQEMYDRMEQFFPTKNIHFLRPVDGEAIEI